MKCPLSVSHVARVLSLSALLMGFFMPSAQGQTAIQPGTVVGTFEGQNYSTGVAFTAPAGKYSRVTDVIFTNYSAELCAIALSVGPYVLYTRVPPGSLALSLNSGYGLAPGAVVGNSGVTPCGSQTYVIVRGFYYTIP